MMNIKPWISALIFLCTLLHHTPASTQPFLAGHTTITFIDSSRNNRQIPTEIYYPALTAGEQVPVAPGAFPVLSFGHGFVMVVSAYANFTNAVVPEGYILALANTETGFSPSHNDLALDLAFIIQSMIAENSDPGSLFFEAVASTSAVMGHSMGGGASMLAAAYDAGISAVVNFAAANTTPSAIAAATDIQVPALLFSGSEDCVTPPSQHQEIMYDSLASSCKTLVSITGGGHCYFADYNLLCTIGENSCAPNLTVTREEQHEITFSLLIPWLDFVLKDNQASWQIFLDSLESSQRITFQHQCQQTNIPGIETGMNDLKVFPVPFKDFLKVEGFGSLGKLIVYDLTGRIVLNESISIDKAAIISTEILKPGIYQLVFSNDAGERTVKKVCKH